MNSRVPKMARTQLVRACMISVALVAATMLSAKAQEED